MSEFKFLASVSILFCLAFLFYNYFPESIPFLSLEISYLAVPILAALFIAMGLFYFFDQ